MTSKSQKNQSFSELLNACLHQITCPLLRRRRVALLLWVGVAVSVVVGLWLAITYFTTRFASTWKEGAWGSYLLGVGVALSVGVVAGTVVWVIKRWRDLGDRETMLALLRRFDRGMSHELRTGLALAKEVDAGGERPYSLLMAKRHLLDLIVKSKSYEISHSAYDPDEARILHFPLIAVVVGVIQLLILATLTFTSSTTLLLPWELVGEGSQKGGGRVERGLIDDVVVMVQQPFYLNPKAGEEEGVSRWNLSRIRENDYRVDVAEGSKVTFQVTPSSAAKKKMLTVVLHSQLLDAHFPSQVKHKNAVPLEKNDDPGEKNDSSNPTFPPSSGTPSATLSGGLTSADLLDGAQYLPLLPTLLPTLPTSSAPRPNFPTTPSIEVGELTDDAEGPPLPTSSTPAPLPPLGTLSASFVAMKSVNVGFEAEDDAAVKLLDRLTFSLNVTPDHPPKISVAEPTEPTLLVGEDGVVEFQFQVKDDHALSDVWYAWKLPGDEKFSRQELNDPIPIVGNFYTTTLKIPLSPLKLKPYQELQIQILARDNRVPKWDEKLGKSDIYTIHVKSPEDQYEDLIQRQYQLLEGMLESLANYLVAPVGKRVLEHGKYIQKWDREEVSPQRLEKAYHAHENQELVKLLLQGMLKDLVDSKLTEPHLVEVYGRILDEFETLFNQGEEGFRALKGVKEGVDAGKAGRLYSNVAKYMGEMERSLEGGIQQLDAELLSQRMQSAARIKAQILRAKEGLKEMLKTYRENSDPELKRRILKEIQRLKNQLDHLLQRLVDQVKRAENEHINAEAVALQEAQAASKVLQGEMAQLGKMLEDGRIEDALSTLEAMESALDSLSDQISGEASRTETKAERAYKKDISLLMDAIEDLKQRQAELNQQTQGVIENDLQRDKGREKELLKAKILQKALGVAKVLRKEVGEYLEELKNGFETGNQRKIYQSLKKFRLKDADIERLVNHRLQHLQNDPAALERGRLRATEELGERIWEAERAVRRTAARQRLEALGERVDELVEAIYGDDAFEKIHNHQLFKPLAAKQEEIRQQLNEVEKQISSISSGEHGKLKEELSPKLRQSAQEMEKAQQKLHQGDGQSGLDHARESLKQILELGERLKEVNRSRYGGSVSPAPAPGEKVKLQGEQLDPKFRQRVLKGMRHVKDIDYGPEVEEYFQSLIK